MRTLTLKHPVSVGKKDVTELRFREFATAGDLLAFDEIGQNRQTISLIANLTGTAPEFVERLHVADFRAADAIASELLAPEQTEKNAVES